MYDLIVLLSSLHYTDEQEGRFWQKRLKASEGDKAETSHKRKQKKKSDFEFDRHQHNDQGQWS